MSNFFAAEMYDHYSGLSVEDKTEWAVAGLPMPVRPNTNTRQWIPLWKRVLDNIPAGKNVLCRLVPYENASHNISLPEELKLPIYNQYFILGDGNILTPYVDLRGFQQEEAPPAAQALDDMGAMAGQNNEFGGGY